MADITGITVIVQVDGKTCIAPIRPDAAELFVGMLPAFQPGGEDRKAVATLYGLPPHLTLLDESFGQGLMRHIESKKEGAPHAQ